MADDLAPFGLLSLVPGPTGPQGPPGVRGRTGPQGPPGAAAPAVEQREWLECYGAQDVGLTGFRWLPPGFLFTLAPAGNFFSRNMPFDVDVVGLYARHSQPVGNGNNLRYGCQVNVGAVAHFVDVPSDSQVQVANLATLALNAGDQLDVQVAHPDGSVGNGSVYAVVQLHFRRR